MPPLEALQMLETPAVMVDHERLLHNIARVQSIGNEHGLKVRPHIKTHKCIEVGKLQLDQGACGVTASKASEALVFVEAGFPSVTVAYPLVDPNKARRLIDAAGAAGCKLHFIADSEATLGALAEASAATRRGIGVYIKIDVGLGRVGVKADSGRFPMLARQVAASPGLELRGLLSHAGQCYGAANREEVREVAESERRQLLMARDRLASDGLEVPELSVGSTPTVLAGECFDGLSEIRPGNYVFYDLTAVRLGVAALAEVALSVVTSVVSVNDTFAIIDAGSKVLSSDLGPHGIQGVQGFGQAIPIERRIEGDEAGSGLLVERLSEEHGFVRHGGAKIRVGDRLNVVPNHSCPVANLADWLYVLKQDRIAQRWRVAAGRTVT